MNGKQRRAWMAGIRAKTRNDLERARFNYGSGATVRVYPRGSLSENIRACSSLDDVALVSGWVEAAKDASPATRRKWVSALQAKLAELSVDLGADA